MRRASYGSDFPYRFAPSRDRVAQSALPGGTVIDSILIGVYLVGILLLGLWSGRRIMTLEQYSVAGRAFRARVVFATLSASFIGGGVSIGNAEKVFLFGIVNIIALWGFSLKELVIATFVAPRMDRFRTVISIGDIMETDYGKVGKVVTGFFSLLLCAGIVGAQVGGIGYIFNVFLDLPRTWGILIGCGIVIAYTAVGGMRAIIFTDIVQFIALGLAIPVTLILGLREVGGWTALRAAVPPGHFAVPGDGMSTIALLSLFLTFFLGETLVPPYMQRLYIGRSARHTARGSLLSGLFSIPFFAFTGLIGLVALVMNPQLDPNLALPYVIKEVLPVGIKGLVVAGIVSIVMSSADSFLNSAAIAFTHDLVKPLRKTPMSASRELTLTKWVTLGTGLLAIVFALRVRSVLDILVYAYTFWAPIILVPLLGVLMGTRGTVWSFLGGALAGIAGMVAWNQTLAPVTGFDGLTLGVLCNMVVFCIISSYIPQKQPPAPARRLPSAE